MHRRDDEATPEGDAPVFVRKESERLQRRLEAKDEQLVDIAFRLAAIEHSVGWRLAKRVNRVFERLFLARRGGFSPYWSIRRTLDVLLDRGLRGVVSRIAIKLRLALQWEDPRVRPAGEIETNIDAQYEVWQILHSITEGDLDDMRGAAQQLAYRPKISILTPVWETEPDSLRQAIESVRAQAYPFWELCLADDGSRKPHVRRILEESAASDIRIRVRYLGQNQGISAASAAALEMATGEFVGLLDHDDLLAPEALLEFAKRLNEDPELDFIYSDEDKLDAAGRRVKPFFKPDWSPDLLLSTNYITHFVLMRRSRVAEAGGFRRGFEGSQDYDLLLRVTERTSRIAHVAKILYHWRMSPNSAAQSATAKPWAWKAGERALEEALQRRGIAARVESVNSGHHRIRYPLLEPGLVSVVIHTPDRADLLNRCVQSIEARTSYSNWDLVVVDNDSRDPATVEYLGKLAKTRTIHRYPGAFNVSKINNLGASKTLGTYLLFLKGDTAVITPEWIEAMLEQAQRPGVGAVGARLVSPDGRIVHAGMVLGVNGPAGHAFKGESAKWTYSGLARVVRDVSAVTASCLMMRREVFDEAGGFDPRFRFAHHDVDLCLRLRMRGCRIVYTPFASLSCCDPADSRILHAPDEELCWQLWGSVIRQGDPFYNPNLTQAREDWSLKLSSRSHSKRPDTLGEKT